MRRQNNILKAYKKLEGVDCYLDRMGDESSEMQASIYFVRNTIHSVQDILFEEIRGRNG